MPAVMISQRAVTMLILTVLIFTGGERAEVRTPLPLNIVSKNKSPSHEASADMLGTAVESPWYPVVRAWRTHGIHVVLHGQTIDFSRQCRYYAVIRPSQ